MAGNLGTVLGRHRGNSVSADQKFCVAIKTGVPFDLVLKAVNPVNGEITMVQVDYNNLPIRCRYCLSTSHLVKSCPTVIGHKRPHRGTKPDSSETFKAGNIGKGKGTVGNKIMQKSRAVGGSDVSVAESQGAKGNQEAFVQSATPRPAPSVIDIASVSEKGGAQMERVGLSKGRMGRADSSSSVGKMMRPHKTIKKGNTHAKPFMTRELWKACKLVTGQALSPKRGDFSDINEYNICCREWKARESQLMLGERVEDMPRNNQDGETRRNLETHLSAILLP